MISLESILRKLKHDYPRLRISADDCGDYIWLYNIEVEPTFQNCAIGSIAISNLQRLNKRIELIPRADKGMKTALLRFYRRHGFVVRGAKMIWEPE